METTLMKYPIGVQNFESLRREGYTYVDKMTMLSFVGKLLSVEMKNLCCIIVVMALNAMLLSSCTKEGDVVYCPDPSEPVVDSAPLVTVIYNADALGDRSYNDLIFHGVEEAARARGLRTMHLSPDSYDEGKDYLATMFQMVANTKNDTVRRLYIVCAAGYDAYIREHSKVFDENPYAHLLYLETPYPLEGSSSTLYLPYYGAMYLTGAVQPVIAEYVHVVAANPVDETVAGAVKGFCDGFNADYYEVNMMRLYHELYPDYYTEADVENYQNTWKKALSVRYLSEQSGGGYNMPSSYFLKMLRELEESSPMEYIRPVIVPVCGGSSSTLRYLMETLGWGYYIGIDADVNTSLCSMSCVKHIDRAVGRCIDQWLSPGGMPHHQVLGLAEGYTECVSHFEKIDSQAVDFFIPDTMYQRIYDDAVRKEKAYGK